MLYTISRINRTVDLDNDLVSKYLEYDELHEQPFSIVVRTKFGHSPTKEEISDADLSSLCNEILLSELKALALLPNALSAINDEFIKKTQAGELLKRAL